MKDIILSIKPTFTDKIYKGLKTVELRKKVGSAFLPNAKIFIYSSSPQKQISGYAIIEKVEVMPVTAIRYNHIVSACISIEDYDRYYHGHENGTLVWLKNIQEFKSPIPLATLRLKGFTPPQSYSYVSESIRGLLEKAE